MSSAEYQRLPTVPTNDTPEDSASGETSDDDEINFQARAPPRRADPRFEQPAPSPWKRAALILLILFLFWLAISLRKESRRVQPAVVHANRYSKEYKFRPAASPVITERLKSGRVRVRGAQPSL